MPDAYFSTSPDWTLYIVPYFFVGGIAGGAYFIAAMLHWFGRPEDERVVRMGYVIAAVGVVLSGLLLTIDLGRPFRFWHMLLQSNRLPHIVFKPWSPMSAGAWALLFFGLFATCSALGALASSGRIRYRRLRVLYEGLLGRIIAALGAVFGFFIAGYTGVLLSVSNRPIWADSNWLGVLFLFCAASTAAATMILVALRLGLRNTHPTVQWLAWFDGWALLLELIALAVFLVSLGRVAGFLVSWWGLLMLVPVIGFGMLVPLSLHFRPGWFHENWRKRGIATGAVLVLIGGFFLRVVILVASDTASPPTGFLP